MTDMVEVVARAICLEQFGSDDDRDEWRCCQIGGKACCLNDFRPTARAVLEAINKAMREQHNITTNGENKMTLATHATSTATTTGYTATSGDPSTGIGTEGYTITNNAAEPLTFGDGHVIPAGETHKYELAGTRVIWLGTVASEATEDRPIHHYIGNYQGVYPGMPGYPHASITSTTHSLPWEVLQQEIADLEAALARKRMELAMLNNICGND